MPQISAPAEKAPAAISMSFLMITFFRYGQAANTSAATAVTSFFSISFGMYNVVTAAFPLYPEIVQVLEPLFTVTVNAFSSSTTTLPCDGITGVAVGVALGVVLGAVLALAAGVALGLPLGSALSIGPLSACAAISSVAFIVCTVIFLSFTVFACASIGAIPAIRDTLNKILTYFLNFVIFILPF